MRLTLFPIPLRIAPALPANPQSQTGMPSMRPVGRASGKAGNVLTMEGANPGQDSVAALYPTGKTDWKVPILEPAATSIQSKVPAEAKPGRFALAVLTKGKQPRPIEQPVRVVVEGANTTSLPSGGSAKSH